MSKLVQSKIEQYQGSVTLADPLTISQARIIEAGMRPPEDDEYFVNSKGDKVYYYTVDDEKQIPAILACVEKWELENLPNPVTLDNFPASPRKATHQLIDWLFGEIKKIYIGELQIPNE